MGADIHFHIEVMLTAPEGTEQKDMKWEHYASPSINRNYRLFAYMADVRNNGRVVPLSQPKGLPNDISAITKLDYGNGIDYHSASWFGVPEIDKLRSWVFEQGDSVDGEQWWPYGLEYSVLNTFFFGNYFTDPVKGIEDVRFVFWFDN